MYLKKIVCIALIAGLSGCASPQFIALPEDVKKEIRSTHVIVPHCQNTLDAAIEPPPTYSGAGGPLGGALCGLLIGFVQGHRIDKASEAITLIQEELHDVNFNVLLKENVIEELKNCPWMGFKEVIFKEEGASKECKDCLVVHNQDVTLCLRFTHRFNHQFQALHGTLYLEMFPNSEKIKELAKVKDSAPIYKANFSSSYGLPLTETDRDKNAIAWAKDGGAMIKNAVKSIFAGIRSDLKRALEHPEADTQTK
jgi:hypothetical protein